MEGLQQYMWEDSFSIVGNTLSTVEVVQYSGGKHQYCGGYSVHWGITSVHVEDNISTVEDNIRTVEGIQYSWGKFLIWSLIMTKRYRHFLYYDTKFSFGSFQKIQADFMPFES